MASTKLEVDSNGGPSTTFPSSDLRKCLGPLCRGHAAMSAIRLGREAHFGPGTTPLVGTGTGRDGMGHQGRPPFPTY